jgi:acetyl-CoA carboxylase beta subunit
MMIDALIGWARGERGYEKPSDGSFSSVPDSQHPPILKCMAATHTLFRAAIEGTAYVTCECGYSNAISTTARLWALPDGSLKAEYEVHPQARCRRCSKLFRLDEADNSKVNPSAQ